MRELILIAHNLRSTHNVGSLLRTADGVNVQEVFLTGYTPYPLVDREERLPHLAQKIDRRITKTALGAEKTVRWRHETLATDVIVALKTRGFMVAALEQTTSSVPLMGFQPPQKLAIIVGREVEGLEAEILQACDIALEIPMLGQKESHNVTQAAAMALYHVRFR